MKSLMGWNYPFARSLSPSHKKWKTSTYLPLPSHPPWQNLLFSLSYSQTPHCLDRPSLQEALKQAEEVPLRDVPADARLASEHVATLQSLGGPSMVVELYAELRTVSPSLFPSSLPLSFSISSPSLPLSISSLCLYFFLPISLTASWLCFKEISTYKAKISK